MSVRAYRQITEPELAEEETFNLWHDNGVLDKLETLEGTNVISTEYDIVEVEVVASELEELLQSKPFEPDIVAAFQKDIEATKAAGQEYILYHCY